MTGTGSAPANCDEGEIGKSKLVTVVVVIIIVIAVVVVNIIVVVVVAVAAIVIVVILVPQQWLADEFLLVVVGEVKVAREPRPDAGVLAWALF